MLSLPWFAKCQPPLRITSADIEAPECLHANSRSPRCVSAWFSQAEIDKEIQEAIAAAEARKDVFLHVGMQVSRC